MLVNKINSGGGCNAEINIIACARCALIANDHDFHYFLVVVMPMRSACRDTGVIIIKTAATTGRSLRRV